MKHYSLHNRCRDDGVVQQPPLPQQTFFQLLHIMGPQTVNPLLKDTPDAVVHWIQIWQIGWPHLWRGKIWRLSLQHGDSVTGTVSVNGMISVTSTLRHQVRDAHGMQCSKLTSMVSIHLQSCVPTRTSAVAEKSVTIRVIEYFGKWLEITQGHSKWHCWLGRV